MHDTRRRSGSIAFIPVLADLAPLQGLLKPDPTKRPVQRHTGGFEILGDRGALVVGDEDLPLLKRRPVLDDSHAWTVIVIDSRMEPPPSTNRI